MLGLGLGLELSKPMLSSIDPATAAWVTATLMADGTIINNVNGFQVATKDLVADVNKVALYPNVTDKATNTDRLEQFKFNFYNPVNSDAAKRKLYSGSVTAGVNFEQGNGVNGFAVNYINPSTDFPTNDFCIFLRSRTNQARNEYDFGACDSSLRGLDMNMKWSDNTTTFAALTAETTTPSNTIADTSGFFIFKRVGNTYTIKRNNVTIYSVTVSGSIKPNFNMNLMCWGRSGSGNAYFSSKQYGVWGCWNVGTSDATDTALYNAATTFLP